jgi:hypothetical protein
MSFAGGYPVQYLGQTPGSPLHAGATAFAPHFPNSYPGTVLDAERRFSPSSLYISQQLVPYKYAPEDFFTGSDVVFSSPTEMPQPAFGTCSLQGKRPGNEDRLFCLPKLNP